LAVTVNKWTGIPTAQPTPSRMTLSDHVAAVCRSGYYQLDNFVRPSGARRMMPQRR